MRPGTSRPIRRRPRARPSNCDLKLEGAPLSPLARRPIEALGQLRRLSLAGSGVSICAQSGAVLGLHLPPNVTHLTLCPGEDADYGTSERFAARHPQVRVLCVNGLHSWSTTCFDVGHMMTQRDAVAAALPAPDGTFPPAWWE